MKIVLEQIMKLPAFDYMQRGLQAANLRHEIISNNVANVNTPNFKRSEVQFEEMLAREIYGEEDGGGDLEMVRTHDRHLPTAPLNIHALPKIYTDEEHTVRVDGNNVDIDIEMANLAKNQLYYNALARSLGNHLTNIKNVITSGGQS